MPFDPDSWDFPVGIHAGLKMSHSLVADDHLQLDGRPANRPSHTAMGK